MYYTDSDFAIVDRVVALAERLGRKPAQVALAWMLHKPYITSPIIGASKLPHLDDLVAALEVKLSPEDIASLEELYEPHPILGHS
jgi:aryl-alcohol dehydrogenase (NADP+)